MQDALHSFHFSDLANLMPDTLTPIFITLALSFLIGLEREEHNAGQTSSHFGGVRTFPLIGLCGYMLASISDTQPLVIGAGLLVVGALFWLSYRNKLAVSSTAGATSELSGLFTFLMGALIFRHGYWESTTLAVIVLLLLELKTGLEALARKIPAKEIYTFTRFLLISAVILPIVPNRDFTMLNFNPYHTWLIVVAISALSYIAYVVGQLLGAGRGIIVAAILGGIYSSTSMTILLAKKSQTEKTGHMLSGAILISTAFMYFNLMALLCAFNLDLGLKLLVPMGIFGLLFLILGAVWIRVDHQEPSPTEKPELEGENPLELKSALIFAGLFSLMGLLTALAIKYMGSSGVYALSILNGLTGVVPYAMSLTQNSGSVIDPQLAAHGLIVATAANNVTKGLYAYFWGVDDVRKTSSWALVILGALSLLCLFFI